MIPEYKVNQRIDGVRNLLVIQGRNVLSVAKYVTGHADISELTGALRPRSTT